MDHEKLRSYCLSLRGATEDIKWGNDLCFCVGTKMFCVTSVDSISSGISVKCTPERFAELIERDGIIPAHYVARYHWITIENIDAVTTAELKALIDNSYRLVFEKLPKRVRDQIGETAGT